MPTARRQLARAGESANRRLTSVHEVHEVDPAANGDDAAVELLQEPLLGLLVDR